MPSARRCKILINAMDSRQYIQDFFPKTILNVIFDQILKQTCQYHMLWKTVLSGIENNLQIINSY